MQEEKKYKENKLEKVQPYVWATKKRNYNNDSQKDNNTNHNDKEDNGRPNVYNCKKRNIFSTFESVYEV